MRRWLRAAWAYVSGGWLEWPTKGRTFSVFVLIAVASVALRTDDESLAWAMMGVAFAAIATGWVWEQSVVSHRQADEAAALAERQVELLASIDERLERMEAAQPRDEDSDVPE